MIKTGVTLAQEHHFRPLERRNVTHGHPNLCLFWWRQTVGNHRSAPPHGEHRPPQPGSAALTHYLPVPVVDFPVCWGCVCICFWCACLQSSVRFLCIYFFLLFHFNFKVCFPFPSFLHSCNCSGKLKTFFFFYREDYFPRNESKIICQRV